MSAQRQGTLRTLQILTALSREPESTVTALRALTGISRPAVYPILEGLVHAHPTYRHRIHHHDVLLIVAHQSYILQHQ